jgi:sugar phosphate isomerase/epimerase
MIEQRGSFRFSVFTKPWKLEIAELGAMVARLGFDGIELPVRPGYPVNPDNVVAELPKAAQLLQEEYGIRIESVAAPTNKATISACYAAKVPVIRICPSVPTGKSYREAEAEYQREWEELIPLLEEHSVAIGVQNHSGRFVPVHAMGLARLVAPFNPRHICAVWDVAHNALEGEGVELALDLLDGPHLKMVNLKNAIRVRVTGPEADPVTWKTYWTSGKQGLANWAKVADELKRRQWAGVLCLTAEYSDPNAIDRLIREDISYAKSLFVEAG